MEGTPPMPPSVPPASTGMGEPTQKSSKSKIILLILVVMLLALGGVVFASMKGYISLPFALPFINVKAPTAESIASSIADIKSTKISVGLGIIAEPLEEGVTPLPSKDEEEESASGAIGIDSLMSSLPSDVSLYLKLTSLYDSSDAKSQGEGDLSGTYSSGGLTAEFDGAWRTVNGKTFVKIGKLPIPLIDTAPVAGQWIDMAGGLRLSSLMGSGTGSRSADTTVFAEAEDEAQSEPKKSTVREARLILLEAVKREAFVVSGYEKAKSEDGRPVWRLSMTLDSSKLREAIKSAYSARQYELPDIEEFTMLSDESVEDIDDAESRKRFDDLMRNATMSLDIDMRTGEPVTWAMNMPVAFAEEDAPKLKGKQIRVTLLVDLIDINKDFTVEEPTGALSMSRAMGLMSGISEEDMKLSDQALIISDLRQALGEYESKNGKYPDELDDLVGFEFDPYEGLSFSLGDGESTKKKVVNIPLDIYTGQPFTYSVTDDGYELEYEMREIEESDMGYADNYVEGTNTADAETFSVEGYPASSAASFSFTETADSDGDFLDDDEEAELGTDPLKADTDGDGLDDWMEVRFEDTDPLKADTDGDGFSDKQEVDGGYDPLTNSKTGEKVTVGE
jgi:hypothetical protein